MRRFRPIFVALAVTGGSVVAEEGALPPLRVASSDGSYRAQVSGQLLVSAYGNHGQNPGLLFSDKDPLVVPQARLFLDAQLTARWYAFAQARVDRGFDPSDAPYELRLDEWAVRTRVFENGPSVQFGQFATIIGNWVPRHEAWQNTLISAPLPYEYMTGVSDRYVARSTAQLEPELDEDFYEYIPTIWGPVYASGVSTAGKIGRFEYAAEFKNRGPSSRPEDWSLSSQGFDHPTSAVRLGFSPDLRWRLGASASDGTYLADLVRPSIAGRARLGAYRQRLFGMDGSFEWHHFQAWAEVFRTQFTHPRLGTQSSDTAYLEIRYKIRPGVSVSGRWNRQTFKAVDEEGRRWGIPLTRWDLGAAWQPHEAIQLRVQASLRNPERGESAVSWASQLILRF